MIDIENAGAKPLVDLNVAPPIGFASALDPDPRTMAAEDPEVQASVPPPPAAFTYPPPPDLSRPQHYAVSTPSRGGLKSWVVILVILLVAGLVAIVVAMSGPNVAAGT
jgi:hypothetical protein